jgi:hypothetical protein
VRVGASTGVVALGVGVGLALAALLSAGSSAAQPVPAAPHLVVDRVAVRFFAPETGGAKDPRFVLQRTLAFEARLEAMVAGPGRGDGYQERDVRAALEHDMAEQILASLADRLVADSPADKRPALDEIPGVEKDIGAALLERLGGRERVDDAASAEQLDTVEVDALLHRAALAAWYLDRASPLLHPGDEQLRDVYRTWAHPYRGRPFEQVRDALARWFVVERLRVAEAAFLQSARARLRVTVTR